MDGTARLRAVFDAAPDALIAAGPDGLVELVNPAAEVLFGQPATALQGRALAALVPLPAAAAGPPNGPAPSVVRFAVQRADGSAVSAEASVFVSLADGRPVTTAIVRDVSQRQRAEQQLRRGREQLAALSRELIAREADQRAALAQLLHDRFGQSLVAARLAIETSLQNARAAESLAALQGALEVGLVPALETLSEAILEARGVLRDLRPPLLDDFGLRAALQAELDRRRTQTAVPLTLHAQGEVERRLGRGAEYALFMIAREALHNAIVHARATRIEVRLAIEADVVRLAVADDGAGFDPGADERPGHLGLVGMRERARTIGAELRIDSAPGAGTTVEVRCCHAGGEAGPGGASP